MYKNNLTSAYKYALISVFLWSTVATAFKVSLSYLTPEALVLYASTTSLIVLFVILVIEKKLPLVIVHIKNNSLLIVVLGTINPFLYYLVLFKAYDLLPAQEAQSINYTWALMLSLLSVPFLKHKLSKYDIIAGIICYFGVLIIATKGAPFSLNFSNIEGLILALASTVLWSLYWIFNTKSKSDSTVSLFCNFLFSFPLIIIYFIYTQPLTLPDISGLLSAIYVGLFEMGITFLFWLKAMQSTINTSKIANLIFISPFLSLIFIYFILGEPILLSTIVGLILIIFGLIFQQKLK
ncbi:DMT family transporter [Arcobacter sp. F2176]|uniref:DMT family transporter n=1 Tax=Arcobacter sp. F2176 TaxID=2044511 RepID=UPI00100B4E19|nr:DMT family transporter [Arcobacter sp. F2176]RXJ82739.1 EamA family transporter [Arcobacter sp. F2176]